MSLGDLKLLRNLKRVNVFENCEILIKCGLLEEIFRNLKNGFNLVKDQKNYSWRNLIHENGNILNLIKKKN